MTNAIILKVRSGSSSQRYAVEPEDFDTCAGLLAAFGKGPVALEPSWRQDPRTPEDPKAVERKDAFEEAFGYGGIYCRRIQSRNRVNEMLRNISVTDVIGISSGEVHY